MLASLAPGLSLTSLSCDASLQLPWLVRRCVLLQVEVKVLVLREELEEQGLERSAIDAQVDAHRAKMVADVDLALAQAASPTANHSGRWGSKIIMTMLEAVGTGTVAVSLCSSAVQVLRAEAPGCL